MDPQRTLLERQFVVGCSRRAVAAHGSVCAHPTTPAMSRQLQGIREPPVLGIGHLPGDGTTTSWDVGPAWWGPRLGTAGQGGAVVSWRPDSALALLRQD